jgi:hypothetical protein
MMRGQPLILWLDDGKKIESAKAAAKIFDLTPGRISHLIQEARDEGRPYALVKKSRLYLVDPETIRFKTKQVKILRPMARSGGSLLPGCQTNGMGQLWR